MGSDVNVIGLFLSEAFDDWELLVGNLELELKFFIFFVQFFILEVTGFYVSEKFLNFGDIGHPV